jgi:hypothetical protein
MNRIFIDMDGVIVDFDGYARNLDQSGDETKRQLGAYLRMEPMPGAIEAVRSLIAMGFEVWAASKPPTGVAHAYADKAAWIFRHLPELRCNLILTHDKGLLGAGGDYLIDDRPDKASCEKFVGTLIVFRGGNRWPEILDHFRSLSVHTDERVQLA